jgi:hypothetical protein
VAFFDAVEELSKIMNNLSQLVSGSRFEPCTSRMRRSAKYLAATQNKQHCRRMECLYLRCEGSVRRAATDAVSTTGLPTRNRSASSYAAEQSCVQQKVAEHYPLPARIRKHSYHCYRATRCNWASSCLNPAVTALKLFSFGVPCEPH